MWIAHKLKADTPLQDIAKKFRNTDISILLQHPQNKAAARAYKARKPVPKGTVVYLLDPKVTVYIMTTPKGKVVLSEKDWKKNIAKIHKAMDFALKRFKSTHETIVYRHKLQSDVNDEFPIVSFFCSNWVGDKGDEPKAQKRASKASVDKLTKVVRGRDYKKFEQSCRDAEKKVNAYAKGVDEWVAQLTGSAENWETGLTFVRDGSFVIFGACAMTVAAPATAAATVGYGALVGGGTAFMSSSANEVGRAVAGDDLTLEESGTKIATAVVKGAAFGAAGAGIARVISGALGAKLAEKMASSQMATKLSYRLLSRSPLLPKLSQRVLEREVHALIKVSGEGTTYLAKETLDKMVVNVLVKLMIRSSVGGTSKTLQEVVKGKKGSKWVQAFMQKNATKIKGKMDENKLAEIMAEELIKDPIALEAFEAVVKDNIKKIETELAKEIRKELQRQAKKKK